MLHDTQLCFRNPLTINLKMACKESPGSRTEIQKAIKEQGEQIRKLKLEEQTDEVKNKVNV